MLRGETATRFYLEYLLSIENEKRGGKNGDRGKYSLSLHSGPRCRDEDAMKGKLKDGERREGECA